SLTLPRPTAALFPYTTLFRSFGGRWANFENEAMRPDLEQNAGLTPKRYVMVVDSGGGPLCALSPRLRELRFRVVTVPNVADASEDRKSTRLNSSHVKISYAVF